MDTKTVHAFIETKFEDPNYHLKTFTQVAPRCLRLECTRWELPLVRILWVGIVTAVVPCGIGGARELRVIMVIVVQPRVVKVLVSQEEIVRGPCSEFFFRSK